MLITVFQIWNLKSSDRKTLVHFVLVPLRWAGGPRDVSRFCFWMFICELRLLKIVFQSVWAHVATFFRESCQFLMQWMKDGQSDSLKSLPREETLWETQIALCHFRISLFAADYMFWCQRFTLLLNTVVTSMGCDLRLLSCEGGDFQISMTSSQWKCHSWFLLRIMHRH